MKKSRVCHAKQHRFYFKWTRLQRIRLLLIVWSQVRLIFWEVQKVNSWSEREYFRLVTLRWSDDTLWWNWRAVWFWRVFTFLSKKLWLILFLCTKFNWKFPFYSTAFLIFKSKWIFHTVLCLWFPKIEGAFSCPGFSW